eukprot:1143828-Pelagomonas_calceolata.AAC.3
MGFLRCVTDAHGGKFKMRPMFSSCVGVRGCVLKDRGLVTGLSVSAQDQSQGDQPNCLAEGLSITSLIEKVPPAADQPESWAVGQLLVTLVGGFSDENKEPEPLLAAPVVSTEEEQALKQIQNTDMQKEDQVEPSLIPAALWLGTTTPRPIMMTVQGTGYHLGENFQWRMHPNTNPRSNNVNIQPTKTSSPHLFRTSMAVPGVVRIAILSQTRLNRA